MGQAEEEQHGLNGDVGEEPLGALPATHDELNSTTDVSLSLLFADCQSDHWDISLSFEQKCLACSQEDVIIEHFKGNVLGGMITVL